MFPNGIRISKLVALIVCVIVGRPAQVGAQTILFGLEGGQRTDEHLNGVSRGSYFGGMNVTMVLAGAAGKQGALIIPISGEFRWSDKSYMDLNAFGDLSTRLGPLAAGAGVAFSWADVPDIPDRLGGSSDKILVINPMSFGYSGSAKLNFGPQGRAFVQGRYTVFPADYAIPYRNAEVEQIRLENNLPTKDVTQRDSHSIRAAIGYTFGSKVIRLSMMQETWRYDRIYENRTGAYDRNSRVFSLGMVLY